MIGGYNRDRNLGTETEGSQSNFQLTYLLTCNYSIENHFITFRSVKIWRTTITMNGVLISEGNTVCKFLETYKLYVPLLCNFFFSMKGLVPSFSVGLGHSRTL